MAMMIMLMSSSLSLILSQIFYPGAMIFESESLKHWGGGRSASVLAATVSAKTNTPTFLQHRQIMFVHRFKKVWNFVQTNLLSGPWCCTCSRRSCTLFTRASLCADTWTCVHRPAQRTLTFWRSVPETQGLTGFTHAQQRLPLVTDSLCEKVGFWPLTDTISLY